MSGSWIRLETWKPWGISSFYKSFQIPIACRALGQALGPGTGVAVCAEGPRERRSHGLRHRGLQVAGPVEVRADTHDHILIQPQTLATAVPQQINTTTTQVQDVHDKTARGPSREIQKQYILCTAHELRLLNTQNQDRAKHQCKHCWAVLGSKCNFCSEKLNTYFSETSNLKSTVERSRSQNKSLIYS